MVAGACDRLSRDNFVFSIAGPNDEQRINRRSGDEGKDKWAVRQSNFAIEDSNRRARNFTDHAIALDRNDFACSERVQ